ncbi:major facilitator superfamily domain-containing protein [Phascolomyces articulosus]|uniref:Major facilitator superfamily domain-containing protein n=1 Tax=Phascolomyces articulosus TaxID=60185 RepID=A0AAD5PLP4_9FUNG|nr:major facilitator superfamily domain-containing protein [Phascolomyces articulosus]
MKCLFGKEKKERRRPMFFKFRSSAFYIVTTVGFALFTDVSIELKTVKFITVYLFLVIYTIIVPIMPFAINAMQQGYSPRSLTSNNIEEHTTNGIDNPGETSRITGLLLTLYGAGLVIGSPIAGFLGDQIKGRRFPMLFGVFIFFCSMFMFLYGTQLWVFGLARFLQGVANSIVWIYGICLIVDNFPENVLGRMESRYGYQAPFLLCIGLTVIDILLRLLIIERRDSPEEWFISDDDGAGENNTKAVILTEENMISVSPDQNLVIAAEQYNSSNSKVEGIITVAQEDSIHDSGSNHTTEESSNRSKKKDRINILQLLRFPRFLTAIFICLIFGIVFNVFEPTLPIHLANEWDYNPSQIGLVFLAQTLLTCLVTPIGGIAYDRYGGKWIGFSSMVLCSICIALMGIPNRTTAGGTIPLIFTLVLEGCFSVIFIVPSMPEITFSITQLARDNNKTNDYGHATAYGIYNCCFGIGALCGPLLGGFAFKNLGFFWLCIIVAYIVFLSAPIVLIYTGDKKGVNLNGLIPRILNGNKKQPSSSNIIV